MVNDGWVIDDDALFTAVQLQAIRPGDEVIVGAIPNGIPCWVNAGVYDFEKYTRDDKENLIIAYQVPIHHEHFLAWRPKRG